MIPERGEVVMNIAIIGCNGQLGQDMVSACVSHNHSVHGIDFPQIDITNRPGTATIITGIQPDIIINCAAFTDVDACETEKEKAFAVNAHGIENLAFVAKSLDIPVVHFSTDYVFDGRKITPYIENDTPNPLTVYGKSKLAGEERLSAITPRHYTFRIAWLYGVHGNNFVKTIHSIALQRAREKKRLNVVNDQFGTPTYTQEVCTQVLKIISTGAYGIYHCTNEGACSWYDFACAIVKAFDIGVDVVPCKTEEFPRPAPRPAYSVLENAHIKSLGLPTMRFWKEAFDTFVEEYSRMK
jgi:dTDP-4-dehydrorhamnose reductase